MTSTIALWHLRKEQHEIVGRAPSLEVHINLWRHNPGNADHNLLDIGIRVLDVQDLSAIKLFVPAAIAKQEISDLGSLLRNQDTLSAVFNEVLTIGTSNPSTNAFTVKRGNEAYVTVHPIDIDAYLTVENLKDGADTQGTILSISADFCHRLHSPGEHYIRLRIKLLGGSERAFSSDTSAEDGIFLSSFSVSEITELRFNEARSLPKTLLKRVMLERWVTPRIETLHYFLVRDSGFDLIASHANFRKMRRLEAKIWDDYLRDLAPDVAPDKMIIYHWRYGGLGEGAVSDVVTLAKFRRARKNNIWRYAFIVGLLGAFGSGVQAAFVALWSLTCWGPLATSLAALVSILVLLSISYHVLKPRPD
ncbi:hypothetical protein CK222_03440 [Mesorhizobium sp. WSM3866]|uniref:hypothetical protein n=1 Tax=Mesorhizobium sp. WSM3866 TaxID=422271 RepID=UPI000BB0981B|nr:hypothetical protein [Mesorhizobium sp. WSM3866]PBB45542.1 hypothetical protein CK222_03440 [Mesorhizobium sp. WSM3866]